jgi:hypothetical protein
VREEGRPFLFFLIELQRNRPITNSVKGEWEITALICPCRQEYIGKRATLSVQIRNNNNNIEYNIDADASWTDNNTNIFLLEDDEA